MNFTKVEARFQELLNAEKTEANIQQLTMLVHRIVAQHDQMVDHIAETTESYQSQIASLERRLNNQGKPVTVVRLSNGGMYGGNALTVVEGDGDAPNALVVKTPDGHQFTLRHSIKMYGGGHGEGAAYPSTSCEPDYVEGVWWNYYDVDLEVVEILSR